MVRAHWYSLIAASPNPEGEESVNVALLFGNGRPSHLEYSEGLSRLACLVGRFDVKLFRQALQSVTQNLHRYSTIAELRQVVGPQLRVSDPRPLLTVPDRRLIRLLMEEYLAEPGKLPRPRARQARVAKLDHTLEEVLSRLAIGVQIEKRPTPEDLYPQYAPRIFAAQVPAVDRALRTRDRDLLIGGVSVDPRRPATSVRDPGIRLGRAFWHYREAKAAIHEHAHVQVRTLGIIYNGVPAAQPAHDALSYIEHIWRLDADSVVRMDDADARKRLDAEIEWLAVTSW